MEGINWELTLGIAAFLASVVYLAIKFPSLYFGLSILCLFMVSSASLAGYTHGLIFGVPLKWVGQNHLFVIQYSIIGCLAMVGGIALAWWPARRAARKQRGEKVNIYTTTPWINPNLGWLLFAVGLVAMLAESKLHRIATVSTAIHSLSSSAIFGLLVLLTICLRDRKFSRLALAGSIYVPVALIQTFASGHSPAKLSLVIPAICLLAGAKKINVKSVAVVVICAFVFLAAMTGWLKARKIIRGGQLAGMSFSEKVQRFIPVWFDAATSSAFDTQAANDTIRVRIDMTDLLAMQVRHQPRNQPFAYGQTVLDAGIALVPRALWPRKPVIAGGSAFVSKFTGMRRDPKDMTSIGLPYQFELYANAGPVCVVIGLFVVGYLCGWLERGLFAPTTSLASLLCRISVTMTVCDGGQRMDFVLPSLIAGGVTFFVVGKLIESMKPEFAAKMLGRSLTKRKAAVPHGAWRGA